MKPSSKHHLTTLIRSAKPVVHPDQTFVATLANDLQHRAAQLRQAQHAAMPEKKPWWLWSGLSVGAMMAVIAGIVYLPSLTTRPTQVGGYIQKGPFISGSTITIQELDETLQPTGQNYQVTTNSDFGDYVLDQKLNSPYVEVIAQGFYYDEVKGGLSSAPLTLRSIASLTEKKHIVNVNILTTLASPRIRYLVETEGLTLRKAKQQAEAEVLAVFHALPEDVPGFETMNISKVGRSNGILLAASVLVQGHQSVAQVSELLSKMSLDLETDGIILPASPLLTTLQTNATSLNTYEIRTHLEERLAELQVDGNVPEFTDYIEPFALNADPFAYRITLLSNVFGVDHTPGARIRVTIYGNGFERDQEEVSLKETLPADTVEYIDDHTLIAEFSIEDLSAGSYTVVVRNKNTQRLGATDHQLLADEDIDVAAHRLILRGYTPRITQVTGTVSYLEGGTITLQGEHFAYGTFVLINGWQVPAEAIRVANDHKIDIDLSAALIANNAALPRKQALTITVQTPDFQTAEYTGFQIQ